MRKLLIISADFTGHGHKSISDAIAERLQAYPDIQVKIIDGFDMTTKTQKVLFEKTYGPITRMPGKAWAWSYEMGMVLSHPLSVAFSRFIATRFKKMIEEYRPDAIMTVHPMFISSIIDLLEEMGEDIPVIAHQADLIDIAQQWFDPRIWLTLSPSKESYETSIAHGIPADRIREVGFPVRKRFMGIEGKPYGAEGKRTVTVMSGSEGSGMLKRVVRELLKHTDLQVNVICGRNKRLRERLRKAFWPKYHDRLNAMGFVEDIQKVMAQSDFLIMRASPNSVMEGIVLNRPIVLFGQLAGQELHNPDMLTSHGVAVYCPVAEELPGCIESLCANDGAKIKEMMAAQNAFYPTDTAAQTAKLLNEVIEKR